MKLQHLFGAVISAVLLASPAFALNTLKKIQVTDSGQIDLFFDGKVDLNQVRTEFKQDIIQLSLEDVSVYPAKIHSVQGMDLTKVFAYQYTPKLTRCRFTVKGEAETYKDRVQLKANGKVLSVRIVPGPAASTTASKASTKDSVTTASAQVQRNDEPAGKKGKGESDIEVQDSALLSRILGGFGDKKEGIAAKGEGASAKPKEDEKSERHSALAKTTERAKNDANHPLTGGKPMPSPLRPLSVLAGILALFGGLAWIVKRGGKLEKHKAFGRFTRSFAKLGLSKRSKMIEVIQTHHLGPKKSISVVKIAGRTMVLGITNESINLIAQLDSQAAAAVAAGMNYDELGEEIALSSDASPTAPISKSPGFGFEDLLQGATGEPALGMNKAAAVSRAREIMNSGQPQSVRVSQSSASYAGPDFTAQMSAQAVEVQAASRAPTSPLAPLDVDQRPASASVRAQIRSRMEGMKQL